MPENPPGGRKEGKPIPYSIGWKVCLHKDTYDVDITTFSDAQSLHMCISCGGLKRTPHELWVW